MSDPSPLPTPIPLPDELREMREKATPGVWRAGSNGKPELRNVIHYIDVQDDFGDRLVAYGHLCETDAQFIVALVNWFDTLTATKPSGQVERLIEPESDAEWDLEQRAFAAANDEAAPEQVRQLVCDLWRQYCFAQAALSTQVQTVGLQEKQGVMGDCSQASTVAGRASPDGSRPFGDHQHIAGSQA